MTKIKDLDGAARNAAPRLGHISHFARADEGVTKRCRPSGTPVKLPTRPGTPPAALAFDMLVPPSSEHWEFRNSLGRPGLTPRRRFAAESSTPKRTFFHRAGRKQSSVTDSKAAPLQSLANRVFASCEARLLQTSFSSPLRFLPIEGVDILGTGVAEQKW